MTKENIGTAPSEDLSMTMVDGSNSVTTLDFNRYNYYGFPNKHDIKYKTILPVHREISAKDIYLAFSTSTYASASKCTLFTYLRKYVIFCDTQHIPLFSTESVEAYGASIRGLNATGAIKNSTCTTVISSTKKLFELLNLSGKDFDTIPTLGKSQTESRKGYSDTDLKKLLPLLRTFFKQAARVFLASPASCLSASRKARVMNFLWQGETFPVHALISKMMACAVYLMSYYTWANTTVLLSLRRPQTPVNHLKEEWYQMPAFKRRAFKIMTIKTGTHGDLHIPKYSIDFFNQLFDISKCLSPDDNSLLFQTMSYHGLKGLSAAHLKDFNAFLVKHFDLTDDKGERLTPVISRFRATGSMMIQYHHPHSDVTQLLGNTSGVVRRHYSAGNEYQNLSMIQDSVSVLADKAKYGDSTETSKQRQKIALNVEVLTYEKLLHLSAPPVRQAHGSYCNNPFGSQAEKFMLRMKQHQLLTTGKYACSDLLRCFTCPHQVVVAEVPDIWCLLSFRECIEESLCGHMSNAHFHRNYSDVLNAIDNILMHIDKKTVREATRKMNDDGPHPLWQDPSSLYPPDNRG